MSFVFSWILFCVCNGGEKDRKSICRKKNEREIKSKRVREREKDSLVLLNERVIWSREFQPNPSSFSLSLSLPHTLRVFSLLMEYNLVIRAERKMFVSVCMCTCASSAARERGRLLFSHCAGSGTYRCLTNPNLCQKTCACGEKCTRLP